MKTTVSARTASGVALALLLSPPVFSQERGPVMTAQSPAATAGATAERRDRDPLRDLIHCLRILDLSDAQKAAIQQFIEGEKPTLQTLHDTIQADRQTLHTDASAVPPDPCKVGADFLTVRADRQAIGAEIDKIKTFIESQLTDAQKARFEGCIKGTEVETTS